MHAMGTYWKMFGVTLGNMLGAMGVGVRPHSSWGGGEFPRVGVLPMPLGSIPRGYTPVSGYTPISWYTPASR